VTLKFLGRTEVEHVAPIKEACRSVAAEIGPAPIALDGLGAFPNPRKARVLWVGVVDESQVLERVAGALDSALTPLGFEPESRTFTAHLTTARFKQPATLDPSSLDVRPPDDPFLFSSFSLMASHLSPKGARYEEVERFELKGV
jgi:2'-5' RNA ligase